MKKIILFLTVFLIVLGIFFSEFNRSFAASKIFPEGNGMWVWRIEQDPGFFSDINATILKLKRAGISWIAIKAGDGDSLWTSFALPWLNSNITTFHNAGIKVYAWQYVYGNDDRWSVPGVSEADVANSILNISGIDGLIIDAETEYEYVADNRNKAISYLQIIRSQHPDSFLAYAPYARPASHSNFPYLEFNTYCDAVMPQAYWVDRPTSPTYELTVMKQQWDALYATWPSNLRKPIYPLVSLGGASAGQVDEFFTVMRSLNFQNPSFWRYGTISEEIWISLYRSSVYTAYQELLGRDPDSYGLSLYTALINGGWTIDQVRSDIMRSPEYRTYQITLAYQELLGRNPDSFGLALYTALMEGGWTRNQVRSDIMRSPEYRTYQITLAYQELLGRNPDSFGLTLYTDLMQKGWNRDQVRADIIRSPEYKNHQINLAFRELLGRDPDSFGLTLYTDLMQKGWNRDQVRADIIRSVEYKIYQVNRAYQELLGRDPDTPGFNFYLSKMEEGWTVEELRISIKSSPEFDSSAFTTRATNLITALYQELLGRDPDNPGLNYYINQLSNYWTISWVRSSIISSKEYIINN